MRISKLEICNYRSIKHITLSCNSFLTLLGPNNHGKSNILSALEFALSTSAKPVEQDFFIGRTAYDDKLWVELTFTELTNQEKNTFKRYLLSDDSICIRKTARISDESVETSYNGWTDEPDEDWLKPGNAGSYLSHDKVSRIPLVDIVPSSGRITKLMIENAQSEYIAQHRTELSFSRLLEPTHLLGQKNVAGGVLPEFFLIPAVRDLTDEMKIRATTTFGRLMNRAVREMAGRDQRFIRAKAELETVVASLNTRESEEDTINELAALERGIESELAAWGVTVNIEVMPPELEKLFELGTDVHIDDGVRTTAERKGHGLQRAMIFALLRSWAAALQAERQANDDGEVSARRPSDSVIFAMEEPELFLHPHAQRRLASSLREISNTPEHQVFLCTHSTHFVDLSHYRDIAIIVKEVPEEGSQAKQSIEELFEGDDIGDQKRKFHMAHWINPDRGELFFARLIVFVEGETEKVTIPYLAEKMGVFDADVSVIDCGSKYNIPLYMRVANAFDLSYLIVHDEDRLPQEIPTDWGEDKIREKQRTFELNQTIAEALNEEIGTIHVLSNDFEDASGVSRSQGKRKGKALAALNHFDGMTSDDIPDAIKHLIRAAYRES